MNFKPCEMSPASAWNLQVLCVCSGICASSTNDTPFQKPTTFSLPWIFRWFDVIWVGFGRIQPQTAPPRCKLFLGKNPLFYLLKSVVHTFSGSDAPLRSGNAKRSIFSLRLNEWCVNNVQNIISVIDYTWFDMKRDKVSLSLCARDTVPIKMLSNLIKNHVDRMCDAIERYIQMNIMCNRLLHDIFAQAKKASQSDHELLTRITVYKRRFCCAQSISHSKHSQRTGWAWQRTRSRTKNTLTSDNRFASIACHFDKDSSLKCLWNGATQFSTGFIRCFFCQCFFDSGFFFSAVALKHLFFLMSASNSG